MAYVNEKNDERVSVLATYHVRTGFIQHRSDGIIYIKIYDDVEVDLEDSKEHYEIVKKIFNGVPDYVITESGTNSTVTKEVRDFVQSIPVISKAEAVVVNSLAQRLVINFMIKFQKPGKKIKVFNNVEAAVEWLRNQ